MIKNEVFVPFVGKEVFMEQDTRSFIRQNQDDIRVRYHGHTVRVYQEQVVFTRFDESQGQFVEETIEEGLEAIEGIVVGSSPALKFGGMFLKVALPDGQITKVSTNRVVLF
jgi:hypothetical protein